MNNLEQLKSLTLLANLSIIHSNINTNEIIINEDKPKKKINSIERNRWLEYRKRVYEITEQQPLHLVKDIEKRNSEWNLDHIFPIWLGFKKNISPEIIGNVNNLQILHRTENFKKNIIYKDSHFKLF